eukprot:6491614-Amphidinium_carterae.2
MVDPFAGLAPMSSLFSTRNVSINLGASTNDTNQRVGQTSDLYTQDATQVVASSEQLSATEGYEPKTGSCPAIPEIAPGLVRRATLGSRRKN